MGTEYDFSALLRQHITGSIYWKEHCFALNEESLIDKGLGINYIGTIYGGTAKPSPFLCLLYKLMQLKPSTDILREYLRATKYPYFIALVLAYVRLSQSAELVYTLIEPFYYTVHRMCLKSSANEISMIYLDDFVDILLSKTKFQVIDFPVLQPRHIIPDLPQRPSIMRDKFYDCLDTRTFPEFVQE